MPHIYFEEWRVDRQVDDMSPLSEVTWTSPQRTAIKLALRLRGPIFLWTVCHNDAGTIPPEDHSFLRTLCEEAASLLRATTGQVSLFEFGTTAVANEVQRRARLTENPVGVIRFVRSLAQESYENQRLSYGIIFSAENDGSDAFSMAFDNKRAKRLTDGFSTALLLDAELNISGYASLNIPANESAHLPRRPWWCSGLASRSLELDGVGLALVRSGDMLVVHNGRTLFTLRAGKWRIWNHAAILARLESAWSTRGHRREVERLLRYLYHVALDLSFRRSGGLLVVIARRDRIGYILTSRTDRVGAAGRGSAEKALDVLLTRKRLHNIDRRIITDLASLDGAVIIDRSGRTLAYGAMTRTAGGARQGARTRAAIAASREGLAIKVSSDGDISFFARGDLVMEL